LKKINQYEETVKLFVDEFIEVKNNVLELAMDISRIDAQKKQADEKEKVLGFSAINKPYGHIDSASIVSNSLIYRVNDEAKIFISEFIAALESFNMELKADEKKALLLQVKELSEKLISLGLEPKYYIINQKRSETWNYVENGKDFFKIIEQLNIDLFIDNIKLLRVRYQEDIDYIKAYYNKQQQAYKAISIARKKDDKEEVRVQNSILSTPIDPKIAQLLKDTAKVMGQIDFILDKILDKLTETQKKELEEFLPAISEYYIDQTYALSGGIAYTDVGKDFKELQSKIDANSPLQEILYKVDKLEPSMQKLYLLHWIAESLLKDILRCYAFRCSIGFTARKYSESYPKSKTSLKQIKQAIRIRNDIAHNGLIWDPVKIADAVEKYRNYIRNLVIERDVNLGVYCIPVSHRVMTQQQKDKRSQSFLEKYFKISLESLEKIGGNVYEQVIKKLESSKWQLSDDDIEKYKFLIKAQSLSQKYFNIDYMELKEKLQAYEKSHGKNRIRTFHYLIKASKVENLNKNINLIKQALGK